MTELGATLRDAREARGLSLDQVERDTRIGRRYLTALEAGDFSVFPAEVYARGFLRSYSSYLGLNPVEMVARMAEDDAALPESAPTRASGVRATPPPGQHGGEAARARRSPSIGRLPPSVVPPLAVAALLLAAALVSGMAGRAPDSAVSALRGAAGAGATPSPAAPAGGTASTDAAMPNLVGLDEGEALARLASLGVVPFVIEIPSREAPAGQVLRQSPRAGETVGRRIVSVVVSRGG